VLAQANISYGLGNFELSLKYAQKALAKQPSHPLATRHPCWQSDEGG
jgi:hypothetical protein